MVHLRGRRGGAGGAGNARGRAGPAPTAGAAPGGSGAGRPGAPSRCPALLLGPRCAPVTAQDAEFEAIEGLDFVLTVL